MKKIIFSTISILGISLLFSGTVFAQGMPVPSRVEGIGGNAISSDGHTAREEAEGKIVWEKLQAKELTCKDLSDDNFGTLGEYFMGQMAGEQHEAMNKMMIQMMGENGEKEMHVAMGKRMSSCEPNATIPQNMMNSGIMPMMMGSNMMSDQPNSSAINDFINPTSMMGFGFAPFAWIFMILFWALIIVGIVALVKWITTQNKTESRHKSALEILKERYVKGEIDKKEFEEKKRDLI